MKTLMILGASELQLPAIEYANKVGIETIVLDINSNAVGKKIASKFYNVSTLDFNKVLEIAQEEKIDGIMTLCSDRPMVVVAKVGEFMGLNTISVETANKTTDKSLMRNALKEHNVPIPKFFICKSFDKFIRAIKQFETKCIIKPSNNSGSRGVILYQGESDLSNIYKYVQSYSTDLCVLVEEYMVGPEVSVEVFVIDGIVNVIQITDKITTEIPYFVELGHTQPSVLNLKAQQDIKEITIQAVKALGIYNGPAHVEVKITNEGAKIVELGARLGGDHITTDLVPLSTGIDMVKHTVQSALNEKVLIKQKYNRGAAIRYMKSNPGIFLGFEKLGEAKAIEGVKSIEITKTCGDEITDIKCSNDRIGYVISYGANACDAVEVCEKALNTIKIYIE